MARTLACPYDNSSRSTGVASPSPGGDDERAADPRSGPAQRRTGRPVRGRRPVDHRPGRRRRTGGRGLAAARPGRRAHPPRRRGARRPARRRRAPRRPAPARRERRHADPRHPGWPATRRTGSAQTRTCPAPCTPDPGSPSTASSSTAWGRRPSHADLPALAAAQAASTGWVKLIGDWRPDDEPFPERGLRAVVEAVHAVGGRVAVHAQTRRRRRGRRRRRRRLARTRHVPRPGAARPDGRTGHRADPDAGRASPSRSSAAASSPTARASRWYVGGAGAHPALAAAAAEAGVTAAGRHRLAPARPGRRRDPRAGRRRCAGTRRARRRLLVGPDLSRPARPASPAHPPTPSSTPKTRAPTSTSSTQPLAVILRGRRVR